MFPMEDVYPYISDDTKLPEFTLKAVVLGVLLAIILGAANAYLGLKVGMTVSATIPAAVIALAVLRVLRGNVLEVNLAKTMGSAGESLAAGVIFTIPAFIIIGAWTEINYLTTMTIALLGGVLGVLFTISLRKILIKDLALPYPEGVACTEVVLAVEEGGQAAKYVMTAMILGLAYKFMSGGLNLIREKVEGVFAVGKARLYTGSELSVALLGVGYIVGPRIASFVMIGGIIGWVIIAPIFLTMAASGGYAVPEGITLLDALMDHIRLEQIVWVGIGAITIGGFYTILSIRGSIKDAIGQAIGGVKAEQAKVNRTEQDMPLRLAFGAAGAILIPLAILYWYLSNSLLIAGVAALVMLVAAFFFTAIAGYLAGVVGSSNNPISAVTITTLLFASLLLIILGARGVEGMAVTLGIGAVVCCAAAIAGDVMQDFKTGQLIGSTPKNLQVGEMIAVVLVALVIAPILMVLHNAYTIGSSTLPAPQAYVMGTLLSAMFGGSMNFWMFLVGVEIGIFLILLRLPVLPVAIGIYLPFTLSVPIFIGGIIYLLVDKASQMGEKVEGGEKGEVNKERLHQRGILYASGLVAGEALMGIIIAVLIGANIDIRVLPEPLPGLGVLIFLGLAAVLLRVAMQGVGKSLGDVPKAARSVMDDVLKRAK